MVTSSEFLEKLPLEPWEVGGELLDILSRGLYSDARDAIREYAQNGIDATASQISITVNGPRVVVRDDGLGMDWPTLRRARRFGMSDKNSRENVGFRGIGLYAAFGMCESLEISTHPKGSAEIFTLVFDFGPMRRILESDRAGDKRAGVALSDLLFEYARFSKEPYPANVALTGSSRWSPWTASSRNIVRSCRTVRTWNPICLGLSRPPFLRTVMGPK